MITGRATEKEQAQAWRMLMTSTDPDAIAMADAWHWLEMTVIKRESRTKPVKAKQSAALKAFLAIKFPTHVGTSPESEYSQRMGRYATDEVDVTLTHGETVIHCNDVAGLRTAAAYLKEVSK